MIRKDPEPTTLSGMDREMVLRALDERRVIQLVYGVGKPRIVQPHAIIRKGDGAELLQVFQVRGQSDKGAEHGWKHFAVARVSAVELLPDHFEPRRDFQPASSASGQVVAQVRR